MSLTIHAHSIESTVSSELREPIDNGYPQLRRTAYGLDAIFLIGLIT